MKKSLKRVISLILCVAMLVSVVAISGTAVTPDEASGVKTTCNGECGNCPVIVLPGINHSPTFLRDKETNEIVTDNNGGKIGGVVNNCL